MGKMRKKRANFTLIELLVVLSIIALITATMHFSFITFSTSKKLEGELLRLKQTIFWAQDLMISSQISSKVILKESPNGIAVEFYPFAPLPEKLLPIPHNYLCKEIKALAFNDRMAKEITLHFDSHLGCTSRGILKLIDKNNKEHGWQLKGFPSRLPHA